MTKQQEFKMLQKKYTNTTNSYEIMARILKRMKAVKKHWWFAYEFIDIHYKAPARLSDLAIHYPKLVEVQALREGKGKQKVYNLKVKVLPKWAVDN